MKTIKLFSKVKWLVVTCLMLLTISPQVWADQTVFSKNFNTMTSATYSSTTDRVSTDGIKYYIKSGRTITITNGTGVIFDQNAGTGSSFHGLAIPLTGVRQSLKITMTVPYSSKSTWKYKFVGGGTVSDTPPGTVDQSDKDASGTVTINISSLTNYTGVLYIGRAGSNHKTINNITVTTPNLVTHTLTNVTKSSGDTIATSSANYTATFAAAAGYTLPASITVMRDATNITANCTWTQATGSLTIPQAQITGNITVTITGESAGPATYTVSATANPAGYGSVSPTSISSISSGTSISTSSNVLTVGASSITATATSAGSDYSYAFSNWTKSDGTALPSTVTADLAVRANFTRTARSYTVTHSLSGVTTSSGTTATYGTDYTATFAASSGYTLPSTITVMRGSTNITTNCTWNQGTGALTIPGAQNTGDITVTISGTHKVTYYGNSNTGGSMSPTYGTGSSVALTANAFTRTGCTFLGWATSAANAAAGTKAYDNQDNVNLSSGNIDLYAIWKYNTPTLSFDGGGTNKVTITGPGGGSTVYYTTDGTAPSTSSTVYSAAVSIASECTVKAIAAEASSATAVASDAGSLLCTPCTALSEPVISGTTSYDVGGTIELTADCSSGEIAGSTTYAWYKGISWATAYAAGAIQAAEVSTNYGDMFTKSSITIEDEGYYWCLASNGGVCESHNATGYYVTVVPACSDPQNPSDETSAKLAKAQVSWEAGDSEAEWEMFVSTDDDTPEPSETPTFTGIDTPDSYIITGLTGGTTYYWWVRAVCDEDDKSAWVEGGSLVANCNVTYNASSGSGDVPTDDTFYAKNGTVTVLGNEESTPLTRTIGGQSASFKGWNTNSDMNSGTSYVKNNTFGISTDVTLYARWGFTISYNLGDGSWASSAGPDYYIYNIAQALPGSAAVTAPTGKTFSGKWLISGGDETEYTSIAAGTTGNITLVPKYETKTYTVAYTANGGSGSVPTDASSGTYVYNDEVTVLGKNTLSKSGYAFCGWSYNGYVYVEGDKFEITEDATLTAVWNQNATTVTLTNFATSQTSATNNIPDSNKKYFYGYKGSMIDANAVTLTTSNTNTKGQNKGVEIRVDNSATLRIYADNTTNATPATFTNVTCVAFDAKLYNSGSTSRTQPYTVKVGGTSVGTGSVVGLASDGYQAKTTGTFAARSGHVEIVLDNTGSSNTNLYIDNIAITYSTSTYKKVSFNKGSGPSTVSGLPADRYVPSGSKIAEPSTDPTATNYIFDGWVTTSGGSESFDFANTTITADKTIYAKWTPKPSPGSGTVSGTANICPGSNTDITLSTSVSGASYQLYKDNVASGDPKPGTGSALNWSVSAAGTYTVKAVETATHASGNMSGSATISIYTALSKTSDPTSSKSATVGVGCALDGLVYTGNANVACQWQSCTDATPTSTTNISDGGAYSNCTTSAMTFTPASTGTYYFRCVVSDDCGSSFNTGVVTVTAKIAPNVYSLSGEPTALCGGTATLTLSGSQSGLNYQLYKGGVAEGDPKSGTGNALTWTGIDAAGTYTVKTVETSTYAEATMTGSVTISIMTPTSIETQPTTSVTGHDGVNFTLGSNLVGAGEGTLTYQWYSYTSSGGAGEATVGSATTTKTLTATKSAGTYYYKVEVIGECGSVKSNMITVTVDNKHLLSFSANSGSGSVPGSAYYAPSASVTLNSTTIPTRSGYVFLGWNTNNTGTGDMYQPGATYTMPATATTLYAAWGSPCFSFSKGTKGTEPTDGFVMTPENINSSAFNGGATLSGGNMTNTSGATLGINGSYGFVMVKSTRELTLTLTGGQFQAGTVIALEGYTNSNSTVHTYGFSVSGNAATPLKTATASSYDSFKQRYVVAASDGIEGTSSCTVTMNASASGSQTYLSAIYIGGCMSCTPITPTLSYGTTNLYLLGGANTASPTITGNTGSGAVTYSSSNTSAVDVNASTGVITAVAPGTATISATIAPAGDYCGAVASVNITVPALVQQTVNLNSAWSTVPNMTFPGDPTSTLTRNANIAATGYSINESNNKSGLSSKITGIPSSTSKNDSYYMSFSFKTPDYGLRLTSVVVPIQPITNTASAIVTVSDGTTTLTSNEEADIPYGAKKTCTFAITPTVFAAGKTITVKIFVYDQSGDKGFRFGSPILVNGSVITSGFTFTGEGANANWSTTANWNWGILPTENNDVTLLAPATVNTTTAVAKSVVINTDAPNTGKLTIANNGVLTVDETITAIKSGVAAATAVNDVIIDCSKTSQGALIFEQPSSGLQTKGTVNMYTKSSRVDSKLQWQYVGYPFISGYDYDYGGYYINKYSESQGGWIVMRYQGDRSIAAWDGLAISGDDEGGASMTGTFVPTTGDKEFTLTYTAGKGKGKNLIGNSWTAPIQITSLSDSDFGGAKATIYIFNTGRYGEKETSPSGSWVTLPVEAVKAAPGDYDITVIPAFQGFQVKTADTEDKTLTLNYDSHVRPATNTMNKPLSAPARRAHSEISHISLTVESDVARQRVHLFEGADFSEAYDNGWDGDYVGVSGQNAYLYVVSPTLGKLAVDAENSLEGRIVALQSAAEKEYTFTFTGDETGYFLNDLKTENSTLISEGNSYTFTYEQGDEYNRFMISAMPFSKTQPTGLDDADWNGTGVQKVIYKDHMYIIRGGRVFDATGAMVK